MLRIRDWNDNFETNDTRKLKHLFWVKLPNQHDSLPFKSIANHKRGTDIFAAWILMVQVASKNGNRGNLPFSPDELGLITGFPAEIFKVAIDFLKTPKINWIEQYPEASGENPDTSADYRENPPVELENRIDRIEEKETFDLARKAYPEGKKRGLEPEWKHFQKVAGKRVLEILPLLLPAIEKYKAQIAAEKVEPRFVKHFQGWITAERWTAEYATTAKKPYNPMSP